MIQVYRFGSKVRWRVDFTDTLGDPVTVAGAKYVIANDKGAILAGPIDLDVSAAPTFIDIDIDETLNQPESAEPRGFRMVSIQFESDVGAVYNRSFSYVLEKEFVVEAGINSFGMYGELIIASMDMPHLTRFHAADESQKQAALIGAWHGIGKLTMKFDRGASPVNPSTLTANDLDQLPAQALLALRRAQVIEANNLLGGNPVEDRRKAGLISHTAGESTHFYRTSKPLDLPICREAMEALKGYVYWERKIGRS